MVAIEARGEVEAVIVTDDTHVATETVTTVIAILVAIITEGHLEVDLDLSPQETIVITVQPQMAKLDEKRKTAKMVDMAAVSIATVIEGARQVRRSVLRARHLNHSLLKTSVIGGLSSSNNLRPVCERKNSFNSSRRLARSKRLRSSRTECLAAPKGMLSALDPNDPSLTRLVSAMLNLNKRNLFNSQFSLQGRSF